MATSSKAAIVTTLRDAGAMIDSFIAYRQRIAIEDRARAEALIQHGVLMRIEEARRMLG